MRIFCNFENQIFTLNFSLILSQHRQKNSPTSLGQCCLRCFGRVKGRHHPGLPALAPGADGAIQRGGVHNVVIVGGELVPVLHHHVLQHLLDRVVVGEAGGIRLKTRFALECLVPVSLLDMADVLGHQDVVSAVRAPGGRWWAPG